MMLFVGLLLGMPLGWVVLFYVAKRVLRALGVTS